MKTLERMPAGDMANRWPKLNLTDLRMHVAMHNADIGANFRSEIRRSSVRGDVPSDPRSTEAIPRIDNPRVSSSNPMGSTHCAKSAPANPKEEVKQGRFTDRKKGSKGRETVFERIRTRKSQRSKRKAPSESPPIKKKDKTKER